MQRLLNCSATRVKGCTLVGKYFAILASIHKKQRPVDLARYSITPVTIAFVLHLVRTCQIGLKTGTLSANC